LHLEKAQKDSSVFVIDVGFKYDTENLNFDHHQQGMSLGWENGIPYSSCGLVWKWLKDTKLLHQKMNTDMMQLIEDRLIKKIDAQIINFFN
jgi:uncharacterized UPF0160 family protein